MAGVCSYQSQDYPGRAVNNYCSFTDNGVQPFGTNRYVASWELASLDLRNQAQEINREVRICLDQHIAQALSLDVGGMGNVTAEHDVTCPDPDSVGLSGYNVVVTSTYTLEHEAGLQCNGSNPVAVIKSILKFQAEEGLDPNCLEANSTRFVVIDSSTPGTSGILRAAVEKCIGLTTDLTDWLSTLPNRTTYYLKEYRCRFSENQTQPIPPTPMPTLNPFPVPAPTLNPFPVPAPTLNPFPVPAPTFNPFPVPAPTFNPFPVPAPTLNPFPVPAPTLNPIPVPVPRFNPLPNPIPSFNPVSNPVPSFNPAPNPSPEDNSIILIASVVIFVAMIIFVSCYAYRRYQSRDQVFVRKGPTIDRATGETVPLTGFGRAVVSS